MNGLQTSLFTDLNIVTVTENGAWVGIGYWQQMRGWAAQLSVVYDTLPPGMRKGNKTGIYHKHINVG